jgi:P4 family phage/plasmid primase-like protien
MCGKTDWCLLSVENPDDPQAVICGRVAEGAKQAWGDAGYLHIRKSEGDLSRRSSVLPSSDRPVLIVEGASDVAAAYDLGYVAIGKPTAGGGGVELSKILTGRAVAIIGENDAGAGRKGMEKTFETLKKHVQHLVKLMPPDTIKDLRAWVGRGLTPDTLADAIAHGMTGSSSNLLESTAPLDLAHRWLHERHWAEDLPLLRLYADGWYRFDGAKYKHVNVKTYVRGDLYAFLTGKVVTKYHAKGETTLEPYEATAHRVNDIIDALALYCPVESDAPCWLDDEEHPHSADVITFVNGQLTIPDLTLHPNTPKFFTLTAMPYDWEPSAQCPRWMRLLDEIFPNDPAKCALLQEWFGYNLVADTSQEKLMFFVGRPGAGKGTVIETLRAVLGHGQIASTSFDALVEPFGLQPLVGKLAAIMPDAHITQRGDPAKALQVLKEISGRDSVSINRKNRDFLEDHKLPCRFTISVNSMPDLPDHERALDRRLLLLHFGEVFTGREDIGLKAKLALEAPGIAAWAVRGLLRLRKHGFTVPESSKPVIEEFRKQSSPITEFVDENCHCSPELEVASLMLYDAYSRWSKDQGIIPGSQAKFWQRLLLLYPGLSVGRMTVGNKQIRSIRGIVLTDNAIERYIVGRR